MLFSGILDIDYKINSMENTIFEANGTNEVNDSQIEIEQNKTTTFTKNTDQVRRPTDYIRREAVLRIRHLENKKRMEMQILKTQVLDNGFQHQCLE